MTQPGPHQLLYIAGPMTGLPGYNFDAFNDAATDLRQAGFHVLNPARRGVIPGHAWEDYLRKALGDVLRADGLALLPGWENSRGASLEVLVAQHLSIPTAPLADWLDRRAARVAALLAVPQ